MSLRLNGEGERTYQNSSRLALLQGTDAFSYKGISSYSSLPALQQRTPLQRQVLQMSSKIQVQMTSSPLSSPLLSNSSETNYITGGDKVEPPARNSSNPTKEVIQLLPQDKVTEALILASSAESALTTDTTRVLYTSSQLAIVMEDTALKTLGEAQTGSLPNHAQKHIQKIGNTRW